LTEFWRVGISLAVLSDPLFVLPNWLSEITTIPAQITFIPNHDNLKDISVALSATPVVRAITLRVSQTTKQAPEFIGHSIWQPRATSITLEGRTNCSSITLLGGKMRKSFTLYFCLMLLGVAATLTPRAMYGQGNGNGGNPTLPPQAKAEVSLPTRSDTMTRPLRELVDRGQPSNPRGGRDFEPGHPHPVGNANPEGNDPLAANGSGPIRANVEIKASTPGVSVDPNARVAPPDTTGDIGPNHYVQWVNLRYAVYNVMRTSGVISGFTPVAGFPKNGNTIWQGFGGRCESDNDGDPLVQYDHAADRWVLTQFAVSAQPYTQCVAVSTSPDPTGTFHRYEYSYGAGFNDYPKMGVWPNGYYITYNMFQNGQTFAGAKVCAFERSQMLAGGVARQICANTTTSYGSLMPADWEGVNAPAANAANPLLSITSSTLLSWRFAVDWSGGGSGTLTGPTTVSGVTAFSRACGGGTCIPQASTARKLDSLADRLMYRLAYRNFGTHESLVVNHSVATNKVSAIRWYELRNAAAQTVSTATPVVYQQGTFSPNNTFRWMGSAAIDKTGGIAVGYNISSKSIKPSIRYAYRGPADALGTMGNETMVLDGGGSQFAPGSTLSRWGDYATVSVDPVDNCTMVFTTEYLPSNGVFNWTTHIFSFKLSTCN
jgi:hypothetical protein